eukprot:gene4326-4638_t
MYNKLTIFLLGTIDKHSPLQILRGQQDILRIIWIYACSEWWDLHIQPYTIPYVPEYGEEDVDLAEIEIDSSNIVDLRNYSMYKRKKLMDCPFAVLQDNVPFPPLTNTPEPVSVNMMPFDLFDPEGTLPDYLHGYIKLIESCRVYVKAYNDMLYVRGEKTRPQPYVDDDEEEIVVQQGVVVGGGGSIEAEGEAFEENEEEEESDPHPKLDPTNPKNRIAYLTVDERPVSEIGQSQRRGGVHVESPGALREKEIADKGKYTPDMCFYHPWGGGTATDEYLVGGIFLASNVSDTTAIWNTRIHDTFGDVIGPHGSLERMRSLLGPPAKRLAGGELIWLSDRTPHESLPIEDVSVRRQFFRLVVGEIAFWFADHNTANPTGYAVPESVPIVYGNKFEMTRMNKVPVVWECGNGEEIRVAREEAILRERLYERGIGFLADELLKEGVYETKTFCTPTWWDVWDGWFDKKIYNHFTLRYLSEIAARLADQLWDEHHHQ